VNETNGFFSISVALKITVHLRRFERLSALCTNERDSYGGSPFSRSYVLHTSLRVLCFSAIEGVRAPDSLPPGVRLHECRRRALPEGALSHLSWNIWNGAQRGGNTGT